MVYLDMRFFRKGLAKCREKDPEGVSLRRKPDENAREYRERLEDFKALIFILRAETPEELKRGIPQEDGSYKRLTMRKVCGLFAKAGEMLEGVQTKGLLSDDGLFVSVDLFREMTVDEYYLF